MAPSPTHHVTHTDGSEARLYIASSLQQKLDSSSPSVQKGARDSVCIAFREACRAKFGDSWVRNHARVEWERLTIRQLGATVVSSKDDDGDHQCDDCTSCDIGYHERCRQPGGCPNASLR